MSGSERQAALLAELRRNSATLARLDADDEEAVAQALADRAALLERLPAGDSGTADAAYRDTLAEALLAGKELAHRLRLSRALAVSARNEAARVAYAVKGFAGGYKRIAPRGGMSG